MLFCVIKPVTRFTGDNEPVDLVGFDPNNFVDFLIAPFSHTVSRKFHGPTCNPQKKQALILEQINSQVKHFLIFHSAIRQRHVNVPWRIGHDDIEFPKDLKIEVPEIAVDPFGLFDSFPVKLLVLGVFNLLVFFDVMDEFAVWVVAGVEVGTIAVGLIGVLGDDGSEVLFVAVGVALCFLTFIAGAVVAVFYVFLLFELLKCEFFFICFELLELLLDTEFVFVFEERWGAEERFNNDFVLFLFGGLLFLLLKSHNIGREDVRALRTVLVSQINDFIEINAFNNGDKLGA